MNTCIIFELIKYLNKIWPLLFYLRLHILVIKIVLLRGYPNFNENVHHIERDGWGTERERQRGQNKTEEEDRE